MYDAIAHYYHLTHQELDEDIPFLLGQAAQTPSNVLELGCGTGRLLIPFAQAGHIITGIDNSSGMLDIAHNQIAVHAPAITQRITLFQGDMTRFTFQTPFGLILIPYNTIMHLTDDSLLSCFKCVQQALGENGRFVIDTINPHLLAEIDNQPEFLLEQSFYDPKSGAEIDVYGRYQHRSSQKLELTWRYQNQTSLPTDATSLYHYRYPHQIQLILQQAKLKQVSVYGDYDRTPFSEESERLIISAIKQT